MIGRGREWCWLVGVIRSLRAMLRGQCVPVAGHDYELLERHEAAVVEVLRCRCCGRISVGWNVAD